MFTGVTFNQAMKYYLQGKEVIVLDRNSAETNGKGYDTFPLEELFKNIELLADVPAVENPEFKEAVYEMTDGSSLQPEESQEDPQVNNTEPKDCGGGNTEPPKRPKKEVVEELVLQGFSNSEIVEKTGIKYPTVWAYAKEIRGNLLKEPKGHQALEDNSDRHLCKICAYRGNNKNGISGTGCEYAVITGHCRGCSVEKCNVFEKGEPKKPKKPLVLA